MADAQASGNPQRVIGVGRIIVVVLCVVVVALIVALAVTVSQLQNELDSKSERCPARRNNINLNPPKILPPFHDLTKDEIRSIREFLYSQSDLNLVKPKDIGCNNSYMFTIELELTNKNEALNYLDNVASAPAREARVIVFRGDKAKPDIEVFVVGPLPNPTYIRQKQSIPFNYRPLTAPEVIGAITLLATEVEEKISNIIRDSYGGSLANCGDTCVSFQLVTPMSPSASGEHMSRKIWFWLLPDVEFKTSHGYDFFGLVDVSSNDANDYTIDSLYYSGQTFNSLDDLKSAYDSGSVERTRIPYPVNDKNLYSSMHRRGKLFPEEPLPPPREFELSGKRYSINGRHIKYMNWDFDVRMSSRSGPQLFDIRYNNERIVYELSLQEIAVFYSADNPALRFADYVDSVTLIGARARSLVSGADCPTHSTYMSADHVVETSEEPFHVDRAFCVFEHNTGYPLRRHLSSSSSYNKFYEGMLDIVLTVRTIATIANYDYIFDFIFHQNGAVEVKVASTGYILTSRRFPHEEEYGFRLRDNVIGNLHHHMFNFKVDIDIHGTENRFETIEVTPVEVDNSIWSSKGGATYHQTKLVRRTMATEKEAALKFNFDHPKYLTFYNLSATSSSGVPRAYRLFTRGMSKQMVKEGTGQEPSVSWARYQVAVTKRKESERSSSSMFAIWDAEDPVVNFQSFIDDDEIITDEDQVAWVTMGIHHIPHMEDFPVTPTVGLDLSFFLLPYNYFEEDPAMGSSDAIRVEPNNQINLNEGLKITRYGVDENSNCIPEKYYFDSSVQDNPASLFEGS